MAAALMTAAKAWVVDRGMMAVIVKAYPPLAWLAPVCNAWERVPTGSGNVAFAKNLAIEIGKEILGPMAGAWSVTRNLSYLKEGLKALHQMRNLYQTWSRDPVRAEQILSQALKPWENDARYQTGITLLKHLPALHQIDAQLARPDSGEALSWHNAAQALTLLHTTPSPLLQKTLRDLNTQATQAAAAFLTQGMTTLANSIDGTRVQQASTVAAAAGVGAMLGGVKGAAVGAALGAVMATQLGGAEAMPLDVPGLTAAREALGGYLQGEIDDTTGAGTPARNRLNAHKPEMIARYLNDYRTLYAQRAQPEFAAMFAEGREEAGLSSDTPDSQAWNSEPFVSFVVQRLVDGQVRLADNSQTGKMRNAFDAVGVFTFPRAAEVEAFGREFLKKNLTGLATDKVSNEQIQQILLPAYLKDYRTLMANENDPNIQREMAFVRNHDPALREASAETLWNSKSFSQHIMRELIKGTTKLLNQGELTGSASTLAAMLAGRPPSTTPPPSDNAARRDGSIIILPRAERVPLPPSWPVHLPVDSYIALLQHTFGEQLGKDPHVWWVDPENAQRYLSQNRCSLRNFLTTPFDHQLFHAGGNWSQELRDAVRLYRMSAALRQEAATTPAPISHDARMAEIESQYDTINARLRDPAVETSYGDFWCTE
ncbi:hypothetical protein OB934_21665 [Aeromonas salmonicida]|uniref:hypothetical protein n=1 Tax=Aeromonas salmonicida TaxID=645 RepID=UPI00259FC9C4|nr:hypothetical protein [Aeromonas salmonicida]MDM5065382.1 hypothetical protein [Aeromonas salmonicida]